VHQRDLIDDHGPLDADDLDAHHGDDAATHDDDHRTADDDLGAAG
jgi:hypothetical protein